MDDSGKAEELAKGGVLLYASLATEVPIPLQ